MFYLGQQLQNYYQLLGFDFGSVGDTVSLNFGAFCPPECRQNFSKIVPNCKKLGLLDHRDGWLRERFQEMQIIQYEDWNTEAEELTEASAVDPAAYADK